MWYHGNMNRKDFPMLCNQPDLVYLDSANTALKPRVVVDAVREYYENYSANIGRATYDLSERATVAYESARHKVARFIGVDDDEIVFTHSATHAVNYAAFGLRKFLRRGDVILLTRYEHNSNIIAWQKIATETGAVIAYLDEDFDVDKVKIFAYTSVSNITGEVFDHRKLVEKIRAHGGLVLVDATQGISRATINVENCDFLVFSSHKMYGPSGVGVLFARRNSSVELEPLVYGSQTFAEISPTATKLLGDHTRYEPGTPNIEGVIGLGAAIDFLNQIGMAKIARHDRDLTRYARAKLNENDLSQYLIGDPTVGVLSLNHPSIHPHDFAMLLNQENIAVRAGMACSDILMQKLGLNRGVVRISFGIYTNKSDIDRFIDGYKNAIRRLHG